MYQCECVSGSCVMSLKCWALKLTSAGSIQAWGSALCLYSHQSVFQLFLGLSLFLHTLCLSGPETRISSSPPPNLQGPTCELKPRLGFPPLNTCWTDDLTSLVHPHQQLELSVLGEGNLVLSEWCLPKQIQEPPWSFRGVIG